MCEENSSDFKKLLPRLDINTGFNHSPHVVILGAGASRACCPKGDRNGKTLPLMHDFIDTVGIKDIIRNEGHDPTGNFESIYSAIHNAKRTAALDELDQSIRGYFGQLELPEEPTIYDLLLLSLRPKDFIISFNWDPLLPQAFQRWRSLGKVLPQIVFLHGNVEVGFDLHKKEYGFLFEHPKLQPTPILYPVEKKDYNCNPFIVDQWATATSILAEAYYVTVYGYSAPVTDEDARELLLQAWRKNPTHTLAEFDIIDIRDTEEVKKSWSDFIVRTHGGAFNEMHNSILYRHPRRSCEALAFATLQQHPWREDPFQDFRTLSELEDWVMPLINEEATGKLAGIPHH